MLRKASSSCRMLHHRRHQQQLYCRQTATSQEYSNRQKQWDTKHWKRRSRQVSWILLPSIPLLRLRALQPQQMQSMRRFGGRTATAPRQGAAQAATTIYHLLLQIRHPAFTESSFEDSPLRHMMSKSGHRLNSNADSATGKRVLLLALFQSAA